MFNARKTAVKIEIVTETRRILLSVSLLSAGRVISTLVLTTKQTKVINDGKVSSTAKEIIPKYVANMAFVVVKSKVSSIQEDRWK